MIVSYSRGCRLAAALLYLSLLTGPLEAADKASDIFWTFETDQFEHRLHNGRDVFAWEAQGWIGTDDHKISLKTQGETPYDRTPEAAELQL